MITNFFFSTNIKRIKSKHLLNTFYIVLSVNRLNFNYNEVKGKHKDIRFF